MSALEQRRQQIDSIDERIADLLLERSRLAVLIVDARVAAGGHPRDETREREILESLTRSAPTPEHANLLREVYQVVLNVAPSRAATRRL